MRIWNDFHSYFVWCVLFDCLLLVWIQTQSNEEKHFNFFVSSAAFPRSTNSSSAVFISQHTPHPSFLREDVFAPSYLWQPLQAVVIYPGCVPPSEGSDGASA